MLHEEEQRFQVQIVQDLGIEEEMALGGKIFCGDGIPKEQQNRNARQRTKDGLHDCVSFPGG